MLEAMLQMGSWGGLRLALGLRLRLPFRVCRVDGRTDRSDPIDRVVSSEYVTRVSCRVSVCVRRCASRVLGLLLLSFFYSALCVRYRT